MSKLQSYIVLSFCGGASGRRSLGVLLAQLLPHPLSPDCATTLTYCTSPCFRQIGQRDGVKNLSNMGRSFLCGTFVFGGGHQRKAKGHCPAHPCCYLLTPFHQQLLRLLSVSHLTYLSPFLPRFCDLCTLVRPDHSSGGRHNRSFLV